MDRPVEPIQAVAAAAKETLAPPVQGRRPFFVIQMSLSPGGEVEAREGAMLMRDPPRVRHNARHIAAGRERPQHEPVGELRRRERAAERGHVHEPAFVDADLDDLGEAPAPRQ